MVPVEFFRLMFSDRVFDLIHTETRRYASQYLERERESDIRLNIAARAVKHPCVLIPAWSDFTHSKTIK